MQRDWGEFKLVSFNVRGLNSEAKKKIIYDLLKHNRPQMVCFSETKLQSPMYLVASGPTRPWNNATGDVGMRPEPTLDCR